MIRTLACLIGTFLISALLTGLIRHYAMIKQMIDIPNERSSHKIPIPRGGGAAFVLLFTSILIWLVLHKAISGSLFYALSGGIVIALIGWLDDVISLRPLWRAIVQTLTAFWAVYWLDGVSSSVVSLFGAILVIVWGVNLYNFMDGIDGLAGIEGVFISASVGTVLLLAGWVNLSLLCFLLTASIAGFLFWNWPPAKIFMGDVGSGYLGYIFSVLAIATANSHILSLGFWCVISGVFLGDATLTVIKRIIQRKRWYEAHREHAYQRLVQRGLSHRTTTMSILFFNLLLLFPMCITIFYYPRLELWIVSMGIFIYLILWSLILNHNMYEKNKSI